ncbi:MAG: hypothetical protein Q9218_006545, partial [Villophora microphyllina]
MADQVEQKYEHESMDTPLETNVKAGNDRYPKGVKLVIIMTSLILGTSLMALDATIISVATPKISTEFQALADVGWYGAAYSMLLTATTPIAANFYKYFDPKYVYLAFIVIFEVGSVVCASAPSSRAFITGRAIAGLGAAGLLQGAFGILTYVCSLEMRPLFLGGVVSVFGLFASIGPVIGGAFTQDVTWRWCFWLNLPVGGLVFGLILCFLTLVGIDQSTRQLPTATKLRRLDLPGVVLLIASVSCLFLALQEGSANVSWTSSKPIGLFVGFGLLFFTFGFWQWKAGENATVPLHYLKSRTVIWGSMYLFWDNMASYITIYYMPFYFQAALNDTALRSGISYMSLAIPQMVGLFAGGGITTATGHYVQMPVILVAQVFCGVGAGLLTTLRTFTSTAVWATYMALTGLGIGLGVNVPHIAIQAVMKTSLGVPIGNAVLIAALHSYVPQLAPNISADSVVDAGALGIPTVATAGGVVQGLRKAWALVVSRVNILLVVVICVSVPTACGMEWLNIKRISREREQERYSEATDQPVAKTAVEEEVATSSIGPQKYCDLARPAIEPNYTYNKKMTLDNDVSWARAIVQHALALFHADKGAQGCHPTIYDTAWVAMLFRTTSDPASTELVFPESFQYLLDHQQVHGGWEMPDFKLGTILNTLASLLALTKRMKGLSGGMADGTASLKSRIDKAAEFVQRELAGWDPKSDAGSDLMISVPPLLTLLKTEGIHFRWRGSAALEQLEQQRLDRLRQTDSPQGPAESDPEVYFPEGYTDISPSKSITEAKPFHGVACSLSTAAYNLLSEDWNEQHEEDYFSAAIASTGTRASERLELCAKLAICNLAAADPRISSPRDQVENHLLASIRRTDPSFQEGCRILKVLLQSPRASEFKDEISNLFGLLCSLWWTGDEKMTVCRSPLYTSMLFAECFREMSTLSKQSSTTSVDIEDLQTRAPIIIVQVLAKVLSTQNSDGSWGSRGCSETTAYAIHALVAMAEFPHLRLLEMEIRHAIEKGRHSLSMSRHSWAKAHSLWIGKTVYASKRLSQAFSLAAMHKSSKAHGAKDEERAAMDKQSQKALHLAKFFHSLDNLSKEAFFKIKAGALESAFYVNMLKSMRNEIFPFTQAAEKDKYLDYIPIMWTIQGNVSGKYLPPQLLWDISVLSMYIFLVDEYMESIVALFTADELSAFRTGIEDMFAMERKTNFESDTGDGTVTQQGEADQNDILAAKVDSTHQGLPTDEA